ncbi:MAG: hypothetical protein JW800_05185, partial [Candidatus Omnitrophica bacterium]|nr:hypothetical protein [Candidatus Omnitrophota bacterium]
KSKSNKIVPLEKNKAMKRLLVRSFPPIWSRTGMVKTIDLCKRLIDDVECYGFGFKPDRSAVSFFEDKNRLFKKINLASKT